MHKENRAGCRLSFYKRIIAVAVAMMLLCINTPVKIYATPVEVTFDLAMGSVTIGSSYSGYDSNGVLVSGSHAANNVYIVMQSNNTTVTSNTITLVGNSTEPTYDVTINGINCATNTNKTDGGIIANALSETPMDIIIRLQGDNQIGRLHYATGEANNSSNSSLYITSASGDSNTAGSLTVQSTVPWSAAIGGIDDTTAEASRNITIAGGSIYATTSGSGYTGTCAIGGGGNGYSDINITGGYVEATNCGTGATIGGGGGRGLAGGGGYVTISGGTVIATNNYVNGVAIGGGGSIDSTGSLANINITGGNITANGSIGGGYSQDLNGGIATVNISGGIVTTTGSIGGGNSTNANGGSADITINGGTIKAANISGGHGFGGSHAGGSLEITGGTAKVEHVCTAIETTGLGDDVISYNVTVIDGLSGVPNATVSDIEFEPALSSPYGLTDVKTGENGKLYLWLPSGTTVKSVTAGNPAVKYGDGGIGSIEQQTASISASASPIAAGTVLTAVLTGGTASSWQWQQYIGSSWSNISGATTNTYTVQPADLGKQILVIINGTYSLPVNVPAPPSFTVTIPESVTVSETMNGGFSITGDRYYFEPTDSLTVSCSAAFKLVQSGDDLPYTLYKDNARTQAVTSGDTIANYIGSGSTTTTLYYTITGTPKYSGTYTDTLTFTVTFNP